MWVYTICSPIVRWTQKKVSDRMELKLETVLVKALNCHWGLLQKQQVLLTTELSHRPSEKFYNDKNMHLKYLSIYHLDRLQFIIITASNFGDYLKETLESSCAEQSMKKQLWVWGLCRLFFIISLALELGVKHISACIWKGVPESLVRVTASAQRLRSGIK